VEDVGARYEGIVTYHDSCHALRELKIKDGPRRLLTKVEGLTLREMDAAGIDFQMLSLTSPGTEQLDAAEAIALARESNDAVAAAVKKNPKRFASPHHFASYCGAAPVERGSGQNRRMQINPGGNRRLNWALHIVAMVRLRMDGGRSKRFLERAQLRGKTKRSCLRLLKTYIARELFRVLSMGHRQSLIAEVDPIR